MPLTDAHQISTQEQRFTQLADQPYLLSQIRPERIHLRAKRSKRCRSCRHILIKPEQKAIATRFKIKLMAIHHVPILTLQQLPGPWRIGQEGGIMILRISNPLYFPIKVTLTTGEKGVKNQGQIDLGGLGEFRIPEYSDVWEYDEELYGSGKGRKVVGEGNPEIGADGLGIIEERGSSVSVAIRMTPPSEITEDWKVPFLLQYSYIETPEDEDDLLSDEEDGEGDVSKASEDGGEGVGVGEKKKDEEGEEGELKEYGFWVTLGLGAVLAAEMSGA
ncbi:dynactin p62 family-domain-containing protein [Piptocephalis cylindrospora]|uniref:Dynactin subunit 4 n=1 Tax=Piptocephalis cylindrospora TaxID=1907219 RepID=A0A4P9Y5A2_9FUNG|nr:dynactin p62 family-domain-containing protein [Piptocephalis cylindrospora]|eukprot:RKP14188.1 dynactin p62 family-domain-containing protein [Piptocephalis cylindrospora]